MKNFTFYSKLFLLTGLLFSSCGQMNGMKGSQGEISVFPIENGGVSSVPLNKKNKRTQNINDIIDKMGKVDTKVDLIDKKPWPNPFLSPGKFIKHGIKSNGAKMSFWGILGVVCAWGFYTYSPRLVRRFLGTGRGGLLQYLFVGTFGAGWSLLSSWSKGQSRLAKNQKIIATNQKKINENVKKVLGILNSGQVSARKDREKKHNCVVNLLDRLSDQTSGNSILLLGVDNKLVNLDKNVRLIANKTNIKLSELAKGQVKILNGQNDIKNLVTRGNQFNQQTKDFLTEKIEKTGKNQESLFKKYFSLSASRGSVKN